MADTDINIMWGDRATYNRFKVALDVQNAGNMRALAREFVKVVDSADADLRDTMKIWADPAVRLFVDKLNSLSRADANYSTAYDECVKNSERKT